MSMFKLYKLSLRVPKRLILLNRESIVFAFNGVKIQVRAKSKFFYISDALQEIIKKQVDMQELAAQRYLAYAISFLHPDNSRPGAGGYFMKKYEESLGHVQDCLQYLILRDGNPMISDVPPEEVDLRLTFRVAILQAWLKENKLRSSGEEIVKAAKAESNCGCADFFTSFLHDQMKSLHEIDALSFQDLSLCDTYGWYHFDLQLSKKFPYEYKKKQYVYL